MILWGGEGEIWPLAMRELPFCIWYMLYPQWHFI